MSYTKLAGSILTSTVWMEDDHTRLVWMTLLAMADRHGEVEASIPGLANIARVPVESCRAAIGKLLSPDHDSRTKDKEGRRIEEIDGGWMILNHAKYRMMDSDEDRKRKDAERKARQRSRPAGQGGTERDMGGTWVGQGGTGCDKSRQISHADAEADANTEALKEKPPTPLRADRAANWEEDGPRTLPTTADAVTPSDRYALRPVTDAAFAALPPNRRRKLTRFAAEFIAALGRSQLTPAKLTESIQTYYESAEGVSRFARDADRFLADDGYNEPSVAWERSSGTKDDGAEAKTTRDAKFEDQLSRVLASRGGAR